MGLKTNKATKTSRLNCQYVGSFSVKDGDKNLPTSEQNKFVDAKLKNCTKKLLDGMPVYLQVSPDGIEVLASDEKTVKMAHALRRISYATVEPTNKLFAYVSHQPGSDMEVVCHTFVTKKKDHAEGLSAALGKLFKQTFAYTLKRRDKLDEAAQKRGAGRRWAKQQIVEGHSATPRNGRNAKARSIDVSEQRKENGVTPRTGAQQRPNESMSSTTTNDVDGRQRRRSPPGIPNRSTSPELDGPLSTTSATVYPPNQSKQGRPISNQTLPPEWETPFVPPTLPPKQTRQELNSSSTLPPEWETPFVPPTRPPKPTQPISPFDDSPFAPSWPTTEENQPPALPSRPRPQPSSPWGNQSANIPPELPSRRRSSTPGSPGSEIPPALPKLAKRYSSDSSIGFGALGSSEVPPNVVQRESSVERKLSAPPNLMPASPTHTPARVSLSSDSSVEGSPTHRPFSNDMENAAAVLLAGVDDTPPPLPRRGKQPGSPTTIPEEMIGSEEDEELRRGVRDEQRVSLTLEDEDWYIPGVSRDIVTEMLETSDIGTFFVRDSQSRLGCYALTMKVIKGENNPTGFGNYLIAPEGDGFALQGFDRVFPDISSLIRHYASYDDGLPCRLVLAGSNPLFHDANGYLVEFMDEEDDKYSSLSDCISMVQEFNMNDPW